MDQYNMNINNNNNNVRSQNFENLENIDMNNLENAQVATEENEYYFEDGQFQNPISNSAIPNNHHKNPQSQHSLNLNGFEKHTSQRHDRQFNLKIVDSRTSGTRVTNSQYHSASNLSGINSAGRSVDPVSGRHAAIGNTRT